ncbi:MAG: DUF6153 family protein [Rhodoglobus sp.]|nr:DUF6153 family protein [Rhodoglobus sp.]
MHTLPLRRIPGSRADVSRILLALIAVPVVLFGMLLMHVITSDGTAASVASSAPVASVQELQAEAVSEGNPVEPQQTLAQLVCILALLVGALVLTLPALISGRRGIGARNATQTLSSPTANIPQPELHVLSISRT